MQTSKSILTLGQNLVAPGYAHCQVETPLFSYTDLI